MGADSGEKGVHFIGSREHNIKRLTRDRSCPVVMNMTCFNEVIEYTNWCCLKPASEVINVITNMFRRKCFVATFIMFTLVMFRL